MPAADFVIWRNQYNEGSCVITTPQGSYDEDDLESGVSMKKTWPAKATCAMNPDYPNDIELSDNLYGTSLIVVSKRLRDLLIKEGVTDIEYLPVQIVNHKKKIASTDYVVVNPPTVIDCIDVEASEAKFSKVDTDLIRSCTRLVLRDGSVAKDTKVFRMKGLPMKIVVRAALANKLEAAGLSGLLFTDLESFRGV